MGRLIRLDMLMNDADDIMRSLKAKADVLYERARTHTHTHSWLTEGCCMLTRVTEVECFLCVTRLDCCVWRDAPTSFDKFPKHTPPPPPPQPLSFCNL